MWKIRITYDDKSMITLTGKHKEISLRLAQYYHDLYVNGRQCEAKYQQYPKAKYQEVDLNRKIDQLKGVHV